MFRLLFLALFFFAGVILGQVFSSQVPDAAGEELTRYLTDFLEVERADQSPCAALSAAVLYFRYPLAAFLMGFCLHRCGASAPHNRSLWLLPVLFRLLLHSGLRP